MNPKSWLLLGLCILLIMAQVARYWISGEYQPELLAQPSSATECFICTTPAVEPLSNYRPLLPPLFQYEQLYPPRPLPNPMWT